MTSINSRSLRGRSDGGDGHYSNIQQQQINMIRQLQQQQQQQEEESECIDTPNYLDLYGGSCDLYSMPGNEEWCAGYGSTAGIGGSPNENCCVCILELADATAAAAKDEDKVEDAEDEKVVEEEAAIEEPAPAVIDEPIVEEEPVIVEEEPDAVVVPPPTLTDEAVIGQQQQKPEGFPYIEPAAPPMEEEEDTEPTITEEEEKEEELQPEEDVVQQPSTNPPQKGDIEESNSSSTSSTSSSSSPPPLESYCGSCKWKETMGFTCDERISYLMTTYNMKELDSKMSLLANYNCVDPNYDAMNPNWIPTINVPSKPVPSTASSTTLNDISQFCNECKYQTWDMTCAEKVQLMMDNPYREDITLDEAKRTILDDCNDVVRDEQGLLSLDTTTLMSEEEVLPWNDKVEEESNGKSSLSRGAISGIVISMLLLLGIILLLLVVRRNKKKKHEGRMMEPASSLWGITKKNLDKHNNDIKGGNDDDDAREDGIRTRGSGSNNGVSVSSLTSPSNMEDSSGSAGMYENADGSRVEADGSSYNNTTNTNTNNLSGEFVDVSHTMNNSSSRSEGGVDESGKKSKLFGPLGSKVGMMSIMKMKKKERRSSNADKTESSGRLSRRTDVTPPTTVSTERRSSTPGSSGVYSSVTPTHENNKLASSTTQDHHQQKQPPAVPEVEDDEYGLPADDLDKEEDDPRKQAVYNDGDDTVTTGDPEVEIWIQCPHSDDNTIAQSVLTTDDWTVDTPRGLLMGLYSKSSPGKTSSYAAKYRPDPTGDTGYVAPKSLYEMDEEESQTNLSTSHDSRRSSSEEELVDKAKMKRLLSGDLTGDCSISSSSSSSNTSETKTEKSFSRRRTTLQEEMSVQKMKDNNSDGGDTRPGSADEGSIYDVSVSAEFNKTKAYNAMVDYSSSFTSPSNNNNRRQTMDSIADNMRTNKLQPPRDLTMDEMAKLHKLLEAQLVIKGNDDHEDAENLLDYALDMVDSGENVGHITEEVS